ncbi:hypothetical protein TNCV_3345211 [Trichonephila clavipes]|nr:hypothetical protein TNCV_3345211 [Trichonephila clavipes]
MDNLDIEEDQDAWVRGARINGVNLGASLISGNQLLTEFYLPSHVNLNKPPHHTNGRSFETRKALRASVRSAQWVFAVWQRKIGNTENIEEIEEKNPVAVEKEMLFMHENEDAAYMDIEEQNRVMHAIQVTCREK